MKKIVFTLLAIALLFTALVGCERVPGSMPDESTESNSESNSASAPVSDEPSEPESPVSDFEYAENEDGGITITKYKGTDATVAIPAQIKNKNVTIIGSHAFAENTEIISVIIPDFVTAIDHRAFDGCTKLEFVTLNDGIITLDSYLFGGSNITELVIPKSVVHITEMTFDNCTNLKKVTFEGNAPTDYITHNQWIYPIPWGADYTIYYQNEAQGFTFPRWNGYQTKMIGKESEPDPIFSDFVYMQNDAGGITILDYIGDQSDVTIPSVIENKPITEIGMRAFNGNEHITSVVIPDTVTKIGSSAFYHCFTLTAVTLSENLKTIEANAFFGCNQLSNVTLPDTLVQIGDVAFSNCTKLKHIEIPKGVTEWGACVFAFSGVETVVFENGLQTIGEYAFSNTKIREITLPDSIKHISHDAFSNCKALKEVHLNNGLLTIGDHAFGWCGELTTIIIPRSVYQITELAFSGCSNLKGVKFEGNAPATYLCENPEDKPRGVNYTIYYHSNSTGFTSPEWNGYPTEIW